MTIAQWNTNFNSGYTADLFDFLKRKENIDLYKDHITGIQPHFDGGGSIAIGYGFDLLVRGDAEINTFLANIGLGPLSDADKSLLAGARAYFKASKANPPGISSSDLEIALKDIAGRLTLNLGSEANATMLLVDYTTRVAEKNLNNFQTKYGLSIPESQERIALISLAYNSPALLGKGLADALKLSDPHDARAEAWYQICYKHKAGQNVNRRYQEAHLFGLYAASPADPIAEAKSIYRMFTRHRADILGYETTYPPTNAAIGSIAQQLNPAKTAILTDLNTNTNADVVKAFQTWVDAGNNPATFNSTDLYLADPTRCAPLDASKDYLSNPNTHASILIGDKANNNILTGGIGNDLLIGGDLSDVLEGGPGNDVMAGGAGNDTYILDGGGAEIIEDKIGNNRVILNGKTLFSFFTTDGGTSYLSQDGAFSGIMQGGDFIVTDIVTGDQVTLNQNFQSGDFGITLSDAPIAPQYINVITGDIKPTDGNLDLPGIQPVNRDTSGNPTGDPQPYNDLLRGGFNNVNDHIISGELDDEVFGLGGDDWIEGGTGSDYLNGDGAIDPWSAGNAGNDLLEGGEGSDILSGEAGNDWLFGGSKGTAAITQAVSDANGNPLGQAGIYQDILTGTDGNDHILSGELDDDVRGRAGDDWIEGGNGDDFLNGDAGNDLIEGGAGTDILVGGDGSDYLFGGVRTNINSVQAVADAIASGNTDTGTGTRGDWLTGWGDGDDTLVGGAGNDVLMGGVGSDLLIAGAGDDYIFGDANYVPQNYDPTLPDGTRDPDAWDFNMYDIYAHVNTNWYHGLHTTFDWTVTPDSMSAMQVGEMDPVGSAADIIYAGNGIDYVWAGEGNDIVYGEGGDDNLHGQNGSDMLIGGAGADTLWGDGQQIYSGDDYLDGGDGDDTLWGGNGNDNLIGGAGMDKLYGEVGANYLDGGDGNDFLNSGGPGSELFGGSGNDTLQALGGGNYLDGEEGNNTLFANGGGNTLFAGAGDDTLSTDGGNDYLDGGDGTNMIVTNIVGGNTLIGGSGDDTLSAAGGNNYLDGGEGNDGVNRWQSHTCAARHRTDAANDAEQRLRA